MDTATLLNIKPETVNKTESFTANTSARSDIAKKSEESFKSAYKEKLKADKSERQTMQQKDKKNLPQNGNDLPDSEKAPLKADREEAEKLVRESEQPANKTEPQKNKLNEEQQNKALLEKFKEKIEEGALLEEQDEQITANSAQNLSEDVLAEQKLKDQSLTSLLVNSEQKASVVKEAKIQKEVTIQNQKIINGFTDAEKNRQNEMTIAVRSGLNDAHNSKKESASGQSVVDFQQYIENSRNKSMTAQPIASVKNFENTIKSEQINSQLLQADKSNLLNQGLMLNTTAPGQNNLTGLGSVTHPAGLPLNMSALEVKPGVGKPGWSQAFNNQIMVMAGNGVQQAKIKLNPLHLGPVEVNIKLTKEVAVINLASAHISTRDAIDGAIPRLKEMLNENGFSQVDVNVSHQDKQAQQEAAAFNRSSSQDRSNNEHGNSTMPGDEQLSELSDEPEQHSLRSQKLAHGLNIVDYYA